ncbi:MAG: S8 family serine peptidase [Bacteroidales bacterium]|nr:S8 family serine peptidase [Bacteroidales bacterium]
MQGKLYKQSDISDNDSDVNPPSVSSIEDQYDWSHGTHIAGIIAANMDNGIGITGIAPNVKIIFAKQRSNDGSSYSDDAMKAVAWVANNGAWVINMSWGTYYYSQTEQKLMTDCYNAGIVMIAAAGNDGEGDNKTHYPAAYANVIAVGSTNEDDKRSAFSQYGTWLDISAPGGYSPDEPTSQNSNKISVLSTTYNNADMAQNFFPNEKYDLMQGTSMSCPVVTGIVALMLSVNPSLTPKQIETCLKSSATNIDALNPGFASKIGAGRADAFNALKCIGGYVPLKADFKADNTSVPPGGSVNFTDLSIGDPESWEWTFEGGSPASSTLQNPGNIVYNLPGNYKVSLTVKNPKTSNSISKDSYITVKEGAQACDTLNFPMPGKPCIFMLSDKGGYIAGNNSYGFVGIAQYFPKSSYNNNNIITGAKIRFGEITGNDANTVGIAIWNNSGSGGAPGSTPIYTKQITLGSVKADVKKNLYTEIVFEKEISITGPFYMGVILPTAKGDTAVVITTEEKAGTSEDAWIRMPNGWTTYDKATSGQLLIKLYISPYVCQDTKPKAPVAAFSSDKTIINEGEMINFFDNSTGSPESWQWTFDGGNPSSSTLQNPKNIIYSKAGKYNVSLTSTNKQGSDTKSVTAYITVNVNMGVCDTLGFNLSGNPIIPRTAKGFATGNNEYSMAANARYFNSYGEANTIVGARIWFGYATGNSNNSCKIGIWNSKSNKPAAVNPNFSYTLSLGTVISDVSKEYYTDVLFDTPYNITGPFFIGVIFPTTAGDTVAIVTNEPDPTRTISSWTLYKNAWYHFNSIWLDANEKPGLCVDLGIFPFVCKKEVEIKELSGQAENLFSIYPNPAKDFITVESNITLKECRFRLFNNTGSLLYDYQNKSDNQHFTVDISNQPAGIYFLIIQNKLFIKKQKVIIIR